MPVLSDIDDVPPAVAGVFAALAPPVRERLLQVRSLILESAATNPRIGPLVESLKWGEPAYRPAKARTGTTVRINAVKGGAGACAIYFHCQTMLLAQFRSLYANDLAFEGDRAIILDADRPLPAEALRHCIALALGYHLK